MNKDEETAAFGYLEIAKKAALTAGKMLMRELDRDFKIDYKTAPHDPVTELDILAENTIKKIILDAFPSHNLLGEELGAFSNNSEFTWLIDPIDGTKSMIENKSGFSVTVALLSKKKIILGVIYDVKNDQLYTAVDKKGFFINNEICSSLASNPTNTINTSLLVIKNNAEPYRSSVQTIADKAADSWEYFTSTALGLARVAEGKACGLLKLSHIPWDVAAGALMVKESGGTVTGCLGHELDFSEPGKRNLYGIFASSKGSSANHSKYLHIIKKEREGLGI